MIQPLWRTVWRFFKKLKIELPYDPAIPLLDIYPEKTIIQKESCTKMFIAAVFTITRTWKQPKCPSTDEWIKKMWHIYTMEYYSAIKRNKIELFVVRWMDLKFFFSKSSSVWSLNHPQVICIKNRAMEAAVIHCLMTILFLLCTSYLWHGTYTRAPVSGTCPEE